MVYRVGVIATSPSLLDPHVSMVGAMAGYYVTLVQELYIPFPSHPVIRTHSEVPGRPSRFSS